MEVLRTLIEFCQEGPVSDLALGIFNTIVVGKRAGLSSTLRPEKNEGGSCRKLIDMKNTKELATLSLSDNPVEASIGMAAINASIEWDREFYTLNGKEILLKYGKGKRVAGIGHFPFLEDMKDVFNSLRIFEKRPQGEDLPSEEIPHLLKEAELIVITGMTLTNHTFEEVIRHKGRDAFVIMMGASSPLSSVLFDFGVDVVCGTIVEEPELVLNQVKIGVNYRNLKGIKKVCIGKETLNG